MIVLDENRSARRRRDARKICRMVAAVVVLGAALVIGAPAARAQCDELNLNCACDPTSGYCCNPTTQLCCGGLGVLQICTCPAGGCFPVGSPMTPDNSGQTVQNPPINGCDSGNQSCPFVSYVAGASASSGVPADYFNLTPPSVNLDLTSTTANTPFSPPIFPPPSLAITQQGPPRAAGVPRATGGDPVDLASGELVIEEKDLSFPGYGVPFELVRTYRSRINYNGPLGTGWDHSYNQRLTPLRGLLDEMVWNDGHGNPIGFVRTVKDATEWQYSPPPGVRVKLTASVDSSGGVTEWTLVEPDGVVRTFDGRGVLVGMRDQNGLGLTIEWEQSLAGELRVQAVTDTSDFGGAPRRIEFHYEPAGQFGREMLAHVVDPRSGLSTTYGYDLDAQLSFAQTAEGRARSYHYEPLIPEQTGFYIPDPAVVRSCTLSCEEHGQEFGAGPACTADGVCPTLDSLCDQSCQGACTPDACAAKCQAACGAAAADYTNALKDDCAILTRSRQPAVNLATPGFDSDAYKKCGQHCTDFCAQYQSDPDKYNCCLNGVCKSHCEDSNEFVCETQCIPNGTHCNDPLGLGPNVVSYRPCQEACYNCFAGKDLRTWVALNYCGDGGSCVQGTIKSMKDACAVPCESACATNCFSDCKATCRPNCRRNCVDLADAEMASTSTTGLKFGYPSDLNGNITDILDGTGNTLLHIEYGHDVDMDDFDAVTLQTSLDAPGFTRTFTYGHDGPLAVLLGTPLPALCPDDAPTILANSGSVADGFGHDKVYLFDPEGRVIIATGEPNQDPQGGGSQFRYGADGLVSAVSVGNKTTCYKRNSFGDVTDVVESGTTAVAGPASRHTVLTYRVYDQGFTRPAGRFDNGTVQIGDAYSWDDQGNLQTITDAQGVSYATVVPDPVSGRPKSITYDDGRVRKFDYLGGALMRETLVEPVSGQSLVTELDPDSAGRPQHGDLAIWRDQRLGLEPDLQRRGSRRHHARRGHRAACVRQHRRRGSN